MRDAGRYEFNEAVTSDLSFVARGDRIEAVFAAAAEALLHATVDEPARVAPRQQRKLELEEPDPELLLLRFLNELIYLRDAEGLLLRVAELAISTDGGARLEAELVGEPIDELRHGRACEVKAATAYDLQVRGTEKGWEARVTLDV
jgi:SHS2 domain-containing protein